MKKSFKVLAITAALACCLALSACGGNGANTGTDQPSGDNGGSSSKEYNTTITYKGVDYSFDLIKPNTLSVVCCVGFEPFEMMDGNDIVGYDIDLMKKICQELGLTYNMLEPMNFDAIIPAIVAGSPADISISGFSITEKRKQEIDFSDEYYISNLGIVAKKGSSYANASDLEGLKVGVQSGTTGEAWVAENIKTATAVPFTTAAEALTALNAGKVEAVVADLPVVETQCRKSFTDLQIIKEIATGEAYGIVISKDDPQLTKAINAALKTLKSEGFFEELADKWLA